MNDQPPAPRSQTGRGRTGLDALELIEADHSFQLEFCDMLEAIADALPDNIDRVAASMAVTVLTTNLPRHMAFEEEVLFPILRRRATGDDDLSRVLDQLAVEHATDAGFASEIAEELEILATCGRAGNPQTLGYMLRGFFMTQRRHIEWENVTLLPRARTVLIPDDLALLARAIASPPYVSNG